MHVSQHLRVPHLTSPPPPPKAYSPQELTIPSSRRRTSNNTLTRASAGRDTARQEQLRRLPPAPPPASSAPPPPPPPPPPASDIESGGLGRRALIAALLVGGSTAWWKYLDGQVPKVYKTKSGRPFMRTGAGSAVGVSEDEQGRVFFFDRAGNLYYDTGDKRLGFYIVTADYKVYNVYLDDYGEEQRKYVGDIRDVQSISVKDFGGLSAERLQQLSKGRFNGAVTVFPDEKREIPMPPNAPRFPRKDGGVQGPPELEEGIIQLERRKPLLPFGNDPNDGGGLLKRGNP
ncbi:g1241 [Coccomyxa viridis]|uniref:G1241 protein n=1 Tax=Coccomyxa viridis TaxID=1274662 RepID=A0ABP1FHJ7_9CHLO